MSSKVRRVRTPEGAKFYGAPIGTPIVADKAGKFFAKTAKLPQAPLLKDWKPGDPTDRIKAQITDVVRGVLDEAGLPEGTLTVSVKPASTLSKLTVAVRYSRPDDYGMTSVALHRQIYPSERKVHNWQFSVAKDLQGHGIGAKMTAALEDLWRSEGIETVTVGANADVGGYAWARLGFEFKDPAQAAEFVSDAQKQITKYAPIWAKKVSPEYVEDVKAQVQALQERLDAGDTILPAEIAMLGYREGLDDPPFYWLGKRVLLGTSWDGVKDLGRPKVQMVKTKRTKQTSEPLPDAFWDAFDADAEDFQMPEQAKAEPEQEEGWGPHRPAGPDYGSPLWAVDAGIYPSDIYTDFRAVDYYGSGDPDGYRRDSSMVDRIRRMQGRPTRVVKIYRAIPKDAKSQWREGDWVTMERSYAVEHGRSALNGDYKIISKTVPAYTLWTEGNSLQEWGYHPEASEPKIAYKDDFGRWFARARKENPGLSRQDAWEQWKAEQITTDPEQGTILAQRTKRNAPPKGSGAEILSKVVLPEGVDGVNVVYKGPDMSDWPDEKIVPIDVDTYMDPDGGDIPTPWDYEIRGSTRRVNPLEPHDHRDVIWHGSKASWDTDYGDSVVDTSPDNPDSKGLDEAIQLWVVGKKYGDFPYVGEMRLAAAEQMGLDSPHTVEEELDNNRPMREHGTLAASTIRNNAKNLLAAIRRAEPAQPDLFRGVDSQQRDGFAGIKEGDTLTLPPSSFSRDPTVAESYATKWYPGVGHERVGEQQLIFHVVPGARGVKDTVHLPADQEVITGGKFVVRGVHTYTTEKWDMNEVGTGELYENPIFDDEGQQIGFEPPKHKPYARYFKTPITYTVVDIEQVSV